MTAMLYQFVQKWTLVMHMELQAVTCSKGEATNYVLSVKIKYANTEAVTLWSGELCVRHGRTKLTQENVGVNKQSWRTNFRILQKASEMILI